MRNEVDEDDEDDHVHLHELHHITKHVKHLVEKKNNNIAKRSANSEGYSIKMSLTPGKFIKKATDKKLESDKKLLSTYFTYRGSFTKPGTIYAYYGIMYERIVEILITMLVKNI